MNYEELLDEVNEEGIEIFENNYIGKMKGLYVDGTITLNTNLTNNTERKCTLIEELGHHKRTYGDIRDQTKIENRKQERIARAWGFERLVNLVKIIEAKKEGIRNRYELAEYLGVTEEFLISTLKYYKDRYGKMCFVEDYIIEFEPLEVYERVDFNPDSKMY